MTLSRNRLIVILALGLLLSVSGQQAQALEISIQVSPAALNLQMQGEVVTIHTNVDYSDVAGASVVLNGVAIDYWKSDNRGDFVAKFLMENIVGIPFRIGELNTFKMDGLLKTGERFSGATQVMIMDNHPADHTKN